MKIEREKLNNNATAHYCVNLMPFPYMCIRDLFAEVLKAN